MNQSTKAVLLLAPTSTTNAATATGYVDTLGYDFLSLDVIQATSNDTTNNLSVCKITEGDTTVLSNASAITALTGDGTGGFTIPAADTSASQLYKINVDCRHRKRYLFLSMSPLTTQILTAIGNLSKAEQAPITSTKAGVSLLVEV